MLPPLTLLRVASTGAKRGREEPGTEAERLLKILNGLPSLNNLSESRLDDLEPDWLGTLSDAQFDMLLSLRLYTGSFYRLMAPVLDPDHVRDVQSKTPQTLTALSNFGKSEDKSSTLLYVALVNARRRMAAQKDSPLFLDEQKENVHVRMQELDFRKMVAFLLTGYKGRVKNGERLPGEMLGKFVGRVSGTTDYAEQLRHTTAWGAQTPEQISDECRRELWAAVRHAALALQTLIVESHVAVGNDAVPMYRGMREWVNIGRMDNSFVSVSRKEGVARAFTSNRDLSYTNPQIGAPNQCCMMRVSLLYMTPYFDVDKTLANTNGWGYKLGEDELILPPGLSWQMGEEERYEQPAKFPGEILEKIEGTTAESYYYVDYYTVGLPEYD